MRKNESELYSIPRPPSRRPPMPLTARAAQFASFAALDGYEEMVSEAVRPVEERVLLDEQEQERIAARLREVLARLDGRPSIIANVFVPDGRKEGGSYKTIRGRVEKCKEDPFRLILADGTEIAIAGITYLETEENGAFN